MSVKSAVDHLVVAARTLEEGMRFLEDSFGVSMGSGGEHDEMGTHNSLVRMDDAYIEVIACKPGARPPSRPRWFELDSPAMQRRLATGPALVTWAVRVADLGAISLPPDLGSVRTMHRGPYSWRLTVRDDGNMPYGGPCPFVIEWAGGVHPTDVLPDVGLHLLRLRANHDRAAKLRALLGAIGCDTLIELDEVNGPPALHATIASPRGIVDLATAGSDGRRGTR